MDVSTALGLWGVGSIIFICVCAYKYRNKDFGNHIREIPKPMWPRTQLEEIFGV